MRWRGLLVLLLVSTLASPALAQIPPLPIPPGPPTPADASVEVALEEDEVDVSVESQSVVRLAVRNTAEPTGTPLDQKRFIALSASGVPENWTVTFEPASFQLAPGAQQAVTLRIQVAAGSKATEADVTVTARMYGADVTSLPTGPIQPEATDTVELHAKRSESLDRAVLERLDGPWIFVVLLALLAALLVAGQLIVRNRKRIVALRARSPTGIVPAGGRVSLPLQVQNVGSAQDTMLLKVATLPTGWAAFLPLAELPLAPGRSEELDLVVIAPPDAPTGTRQSILVTAAGSQNPRRPATLSFEVTVADPLARRRD